MPRWAWFVPLAVLCVMGGLMGYRYGWIAANMTETAAIETYAARYAARTGRSASDCSAVPGDTVWLIVRCGAGAGLHEYRVNRLGGLVGETRPGNPRVEEPKT